MSLILLTDASTLFVLQVASVLLAL